jgi:hypothetical protein
MSLKKKRNIIVAVREIELSANTKELRGRKNDNKGKRRAKQSSIAIVFAK